MHKQIKIKKSLWDMIVSGEKEYEFRKLEKGLTTGTYEFVSIESTQRCGKGHRNENLQKTQEFIGLEDWYNTTCVVKGCRGRYTGWAEPKYIFGTAKLKPISINMKLDSNYITLGRITDFFIYADGEICIDKETHDFVQENYVGKHDFVAYEISEVEDETKH